MQLVTTAIVIAFAAGVLVGMTAADVRQQAEAAIAPAPTALVPDTAQDYIKQYLCLHAIETGNHAVASHCL